MESSSWKSLCCIFWLELQWYMQIGGENGGGSPALWGRWWSHLAHQFLKHVLSPIICTISVHVYNELKGSYNDICPIFDYLYPGTVDIFVNLTRQWGEQARFLFCSKRNRNGYLHSSNSIPSHRAVSFISFPFYAFLGLDLPSNLFYWIPNHVFRKISCSYTDFASSLLRVHLAHCSLLGNLWKFFETNLSKSLHWISCVSHFWARVSA